MANLWNSPEQAKWKTGALAIGSSEACMLGGVAAWLRWKDRRDVYKRQEQCHQIIFHGYLYFEDYHLLWIHRAQWRAYEWKIGRAHV